MSASSKKARVVRASLQAPPSREWWLAPIVACVCLAPFTPLLLPDDRVITDNSFCDYGSFQLPIREFAREEFLAGRFPLWIPYIGCGTPLHAGQQASLCHPILTPLVLLLGANHGIKVSLFVSLALAFAGAYRLARALSISRCGASLTALVVTWSAFPVLHLMEGHVTIILEYAMVPWFFAALDRLLRSPSPPSAACLALAVGLMSLCGQPQILYYTLLFGFLWITGSLLFGVASEARPRSIVWGIAALVCGVMIGAVQLLPSLELTLDGISRSDRGTTDYASHQALNATDLSRLLVPNAMGDPLCGLPSFDEADYFHERTGYAGVLPLFLAVYGLARRGCARWQWGAATLLLFGLTIALANNTPFFGTLSHVLPGLTLFRCPGRVFSVVTPLAAVLAGRGLDSWADREPAGGCRNLWPARFLGGFLLALLAFGSSEAFHRYEWSDYFHYARQRLRWEFADSSATLVVAAVVLAALPRRLPSALCCVAAMAFTALDLCDHTVANFSLDERRTAVRPSVGSETVWQTHSRDAGVRVIDSPDLRCTPGMLSYSKIVPLLVSMRLSSVVTDEGGVLPDSLSRLHRALQKAPTVALAVSGCNFTCDHTGELWDPLPGALPKIRLVPLAHRDTLFKPIEELQPADVASLRGAALGRISVMHDDAQNLSLNVSASDDALLVLADLFYPGWHCAVDGLPATVEAAHGIFRCVTIPVGQHRVTFAYDPLSFRLGLAGSVSGLLLSSGLLVGGLRRRPRESRGR